MSCMHVYLTELQFLICEMGSAVPTLQDRNGAELGLVLYKVPNMCLRPSKQQVNG